MNSTKVVAGILAGLAAGALLGILFAPDKGSNTRKRVWEKSRDYADQLKSKYDEFSQSASQKFEKAGKETEDLIAKGKAKYSEMNSNV